MSARVYAGNLDSGITDQGFRDAFAPYGQIVDASVMRDRDSGRSRGFGFVTFSNAYEADSAISALNEQELNGRRLKVRFANAR